MDQSKTSRSAMDFSMEFFLHFYFVVYREWAISWMAKLCTRKEEKKDQKTKLYRNTKINFTPYIYIYIRGAAIGKFVTYILCLWVMSRAATNTLQPCTRNPVSSFSNLFVRLLPD